MSLAVPRFPRRRTIRAGVGCVLGGGLVAAATVVAGQDPPPPPAAVAPADPAPSAAPAPPAAAAAPAAKPRESSQRLKLETSDGVQVAAWYYPPRPPAAAAANAADADAEPAGPPAVVILLHDLDGSHLTVEPLAKALQQRGIAVVAPDLRGHGESGGRGLPGGGGEALTPRTIKKADLEAIVRTGGGRVRDQATVRGDVEAVRGWIKELAAKGGCDFDRLFLVGSGLGGALAAHWVVADAEWPGLASGPQGGNVRGIVLVSPAWTTRGFSVSPALAAEPFARSLPVLVIAGKGDDDAVRLFAQLKRQRPDSWYEKRGGQPASRAAKAQDTTPLLYLMQLDAAQSGDALASQRSTDPRRAGGDPAGLIAGFIDTMSASER
jgi:alpha-beta hydrolase superfamily lysophospholipase